MNTEKESRIYGLVVTIDIHIHFLVELSVACLCCDLLLNSRKSEWENEKDGGFNYFLCQYCCEITNFIIRFMVDLCIQKLIFSFHFFIVFIFMLNTHSDDRLSLAEFTLICRALFRNDKGHIYIVKSDHLEQMFAVFDKNQDGKFTEKHVLNDRTKKLRN